MRKTNIFAKGISVILTLAFLFAMAIPAFAATTEEHDEAKLEIVNFDTYSDIASFYKITYRVVMSCDKTCLKDAVVKVDGKVISYASFKLDSATGKYVYEGSAYKYNTSYAKITLNVTDKNSETEDQTLVLKVKDIINTYPKAYVSSIGAGVSVLGNTIISLNAVDNEGIKSIAINGKVIANEAKTGGSKTFSMIHPVYDGFYYMVVTDIKGNETTAYFTVKNGEITNQSAGSFPIEGDLSTYIPFYYYFGYSSLEEMIEENPMLYYYYILNNKDGNLPGLYPSISLPSFGEDVDPYILYLYLNGKLDMDSLIPSFGTDKDSYLWYLILNGKLDMDSMIPSIGADKDSYLWYLYMNGIITPDTMLPSFGTDKDSYLWYLYMNGLLDSDIFGGEDEMSIYYLMMLLRGEDGNLSSDAISNLLIYKYLSNDAVSFTNGNKIIVTEEGETHKLTAPEIVNDKNAKYQWQKLVNGKWINVLGATDKEYTLPAIVKGERYRVTISCKYYYSVLTSSIYTAGKTGVTILEPSTPSMPTVPPTTPSTPSTPTTPSDEFTAEDIVIKGVSFPLIQVKVGQTVDLVPNCMGYWSVDSANATIESTFGLAKLTGVAEGRAVLTFTGFDGNGNMAVKYIFVQIVK